MDRSVKIEKLVIDKVSEFAIGEFDNLRPKIQEQLLQIEKYFNELENEQEQVARRIRSLRKINLLSISKDTCVTRSSIYNNPNTLKVYVEKRLQQIQSKDIFSLNKVEELETKHEDLSSCLSGFQQKIAENVHLNLKINELEAELINLIKINESISKKNNSLIEENREISRRLQEKSFTKIVRFKNE